LTDDPPAPAETGPPSTAAIDLTDRAQFESAVRGLLPTLHRLALSLCRDHAEADDLLQEALVRAHARAEDFEGRGTLVAWLSQIIRREFVVMRRDARRRQGIFDRIVSTWQDALEGVMGRPAVRDPESDALLGEEAGALLAALRTLPEDQRLVVLLCDVEELSHAEAASALGIAIGTVKSRQRRGRAALEKAYRALPVGDALTRDESTPTGRTVGTWEEER